MEQSLKDLIDKIKTETKYEVKFVLCWYMIGTIDSEIYDTYERALELSQGETKVIPVIVEKDD